MTRLSKMHPMPVSACNVMAASQVKIMVAIVMPWPCYSSLCTKLSSPIALVNSELSNPLDSPLGCYLAISDAISNARLYI